MKKIHIKLVYSAQQFAKGENPKQDASLGLLYIAGKLREHCYNVSILDICTGDNGDNLKTSFYNRINLGDNYFRVGLDPDKYKEKLRGHQIVGVTSIFTSQTHNCLEVANMAKEVDPDILTVAGGGNAEFYYKLFLDNSFDIIVFGEGEDTMLEIAECVERSQSYSNIRNIAYKSNNGEIVVNPARPVPRDLDKLPLPAWDLLPLKRYWEIGDPRGGSLDNKAKYLTMQTSRGCPFSCSYCHMSKKKDTPRIRYKSYERVMKEVDIVKKLGAEYLFLEDDSLFANRKRIKKIFLGLKGKGLKIINGNGINTAHFFKRDYKNKSYTVDSAMLDLMMDVGWQELSYPFESGNQRILDKYASSKWSINNHDVIELVKISKKKGLRINGYFTIGYPDETYDELTDSFMLARKVKDAGLDVVVFYIVTPCPGSALYDIALENNNIPEEINFKNMKFGIPNMINTVIPPEVIQYTRQLVYALLN